MWLWLSIKTVETVIQAVNLSKDLFYEVHVLQTSVITDVCKTWTS